ncbi:tetratricopeptide repeat protein [Streptomyces sp. NPDC059076]|uniref:tetratricopeptide repeat protein n=1 Tax=unclassified Streptomyces TaxID=2593676 RepID=UPI0036C15920
MGADAERFWAELRAVYEAAGSPKLARLVALAGDRRPPVAPASDTSISSWLTGTAVPGPRTTEFFLLVALFLQERAVAEGSGYAPRSQGWWSLALSKAQAERSRARGGRPRTAAPPAPPAGPVTLPAPPSEFTGREAAVREVLDWLDPSNGHSGDSGTVVVSGMGGVGKTALALQAAHQARKRGWFPGGILFADLRGFSPESALDAAAVTDRFLRALGRKVPPTAEGKRDAWLLALDELAERGRPLLAVLDNVRTAEQIVALAPPSPHRVLITSRQTLSDLPAHRVGLAPLTTDEAVALLGRALRVGGRGDERIAGQHADARRLAGLCGYLPLALRVVAALLRDEPHRALAGLCDDLAGLADDLDVLAYDGVDEQGRPLAVRACFELSYRHLTGPQAQTFRLVAAAPGTDISTAAATVLLGLPGTRRLLAGLARAHLVQQPSDDRWSMHDLVRLFAVDHGQAQARADGRKEALDRLLEHYRAATEAADAHLGPGHEDQEHRFTGLEEALAWLDAEHPNLVAVVYRAAALGRPDISVHLAFALSRYFDRRRHVDDWVNVSAIAFDLLRRSDSPDGMADAMNNFAVALAAARRFDDAAVVHTRVLALRRGAGNRKGVAGSLLGLGNVYAKKRQFDEAIHAYTHAAETFGELGDQRKRADALANLVGVLNDQRRFHEALALLHQVTELRGSTADLEEQRDSWLHFGEALAGVRDFERAVQAFVSAVDLSRQIADRHGEAISLTNLGNTLRAVRRIEEAISAHSRAAELLHGIGDRHGEALARSNLGLGLLDARRLDEAVEAHGQAARAFRDARDPHGEGLALTNAGMGLVQLGRPGEALNNHLRAVELLRGTGSHSEGIALNNLGCARRRVGQFEEAIEDHEKAAEIYRRTSDRLSEADALNNIGLARRELGQFEEAVAAHLAATAIYREIAERPGEARASANLAGALIGMGRYEEAVTASRQAVEIFEAVGDLHGAALGYANTGTALIQLSRFDEAIDVCRKALDLFRGTNDPAGADIAYQNLFHAIHRRRGSVD